ncbi:M20/M25/M40 family metallo-hydrolase [Marinilactibacillus sp. GCM10026970]|uniref:M20/M25/M40 family metallo-hydrolase n=1 Tax=Marinilactibacillus sp. GCM10026970 TaxID=3252642 RepID=UPI0036150723
MISPNITQENLLQYSEFLRIPSVSIEKTGIQESITWLKAAFNRMHAQEIEVWNDFGDSPVVMTKFYGNSDQTLLIYNHYDVQPIGDAQAWTTVPFEPTIKDQKLFCRGASDCKGEIIARLMMIDHFQNTGGLPCNIVFFIEGEEEIGSPNLKHYIEKYQERLKADVSLWECGWKNENEQLEISCGVKGILSFDLEVHTAQQAIHSSYAGIIQNAGWQLVQCLASLKNHKNDITINGFHDDIEPLDDYLVEMIEQLDFDVEKFSDSLKLYASLIEGNYQKTLISEPTLNISQIKVGDQSSNNSIPASASARIDCRFVPKQSPDRLIQLIETHLKEHDFENVVIKNVHSEIAYRSDLSSPYVSRLIDSVRKIYGEDNYQLMPNFAGGGPMALFGERLNIPIVALGCSYSGSNVHSSNEHIRLNDLEQNVHCLIDWIEQFSRSI